MMEVIKAINLTKEYRRKCKNSTIRQMFAPRYEMVKAVHNINFTVNKGDVIGYVGPNGCGKSTTIKMLCGIMEPTNGEVLIDGININKNRITNNRKIGVVFGNRSQLWWDLPVIDSFKLYKKMYQISDGDFRNNIELFDNIIGIGKLLNVPERQLSLGQKMKCNIAVSFLHNPRIIFMDEPTLGVDYISKKNIRGFIKEINKTKETTFLITSHDFQDIEEMCNRIIVINKGNIISNSPIDDIKKEYLKKKTIVLEFDSNVDRLSQRLRELNLNSSIMDETHLSIEYDLNKKNVIELLNKINEEEHIIDISVHEKGTGEIISEITS